MPPRFGTDSLLIIPCCAAKSAGGTHIGNNGDPMVKLVTPERYSAMIAARRTVLQSVHDNPEFTSDKNLKNRTLKDGVDFGGNDASGKYMPALARYEGYLYSVEGLEAAIKRVIATGDGPKIMILSALYGPLDPFSPIQDYNLRMSDPPARAWRKEFPTFLADFVRRNEVRRVVCYLGSSTAYLKVATKAVTELRSLGLEIEAVQYHVVEGSSSITPRRHGSRLLCDLGGASDADSYDPTKIRERPF